MKSALWVGIVILIAMLIGKPDYVDCPRGSVVSSGIGMCK